jgi:hypothetical protein
MEFRAAIYLSFKKTRCSLSFIVINVIIILTELQNKLSQLFYILVIDFQSLIEDCLFFGKSHQSTCATFQD